MRFGAHSYLFIDRWSDEHLDILDRARGLGLPVYQGYGLSEAASVESLNRPGANRPGSVGRPLPQLDVRIAADSEVILAGTFLGKPAAQEHIDKAWGSR